MQQRGKQILIWSVVAVAGAGTLGAIGVGLWLYANTDDPGFIEHPVVDRAVVSACETMTEKVRSAAVPRGSSTTARVTAIRRQDQAVRDFVDEVLAVGPERLDDDLPSRSWLRDWESIVSLRDRAAAELEAGATASFTVPRVNGIPVTERMNESANCDVPVELTTLP